MKTYKKSYFFANFFEKERFSETRDVKAVVEAGGARDRLESRARARAGTGFGLKEQQKQMIPLF